MNREQFMNYLILDGWVGCGGGEIKNPNTMRYAKLIYIKQGQRYTVSEQPYYKGSQVDATDRPLPSWYSKARLGAWARHFGVSYEP